MILTPRGSVFFCERAARRYPICHKLTPNAVVSAECDCHAFSVTFVTSRHEMGLRRNL